MRFALMRLVDKRIPLDLLLRRGTLEELLNRTYDLKYQITSAEEQQTQGKAAASEAQKLTAQAARAREDQRSAGIRERPGASHALCALAQRATVPPA